jgi:hypothetical protein
VADRLFSMMAPVAMNQAHRMSSAFEALCAQACLESAMTGALISRGMQPGQAQMTVDQWRALGMSISPSLYAPAHVAESTLQGTAPMVARQAMAQPGPITALGLAPGYEQLGAQLGIRPQAGMMGQAPMRVQPGIGKMAQPGIGKMAQPGMMMHPGVMGGQSPQGFGSQ